MQDVLNFIVTNLPLILCLVVGVGLIVLEVFLPGFGLPGISGIILLVVSVVLTWINYGVIAGLAMTIIALALAGLAISASLKSAATGKLSRSSLILTGGEKPPEESEMDAFLGKEGVTTTVLRPAGIAEFDGVRLNVVSDGEYIAKDQRVVVTLVEGTRILVKAAKA